MRRLPHLTRSVTVFLLVAAWRIAPAGSCGSDGEPVSIGVYPGPLPTGLLLAAGAASRGADVDGGARAAGATSIAVVAGVSVAAGVAVTGGVAGGVAGGGWDVPRSVGTTINTAELDCAPAISYQGDRLYFEREIEPYGYNDIFVSVLTDSGWSAPENLGPPVNTEQFGESKPFVSPGGDSLLFCRRGDIYLATRDGGIWNEPVPFSDSINSSDIETSPCLAADGQEFFFTSDRSGGYGWMDIYVSTWDGAQWSTPENLGPNVNTSDNEWYCCLSPDGSTLYFITWRPGGYGNIDIWHAERQAGGGWSLPTNLGGLANHSGPSCKPSIAADGRSVYFGGTQPGEMMGDLDIWVTTWSEEEEP